MAKGIKTGGRQKGSLNKNTSAAKDCLVDAFHAIGGVDKLVEWGKENLAEFYKLWGRIIPLDLNHGGQQDNPIKTALPDEDKKLLDDWLKQQRGKP